MPTLYKYGLILLLVFISVVLPTADAHLLNMTKVQVHILDSGEINLEIKLDLAREFSGDENYYFISQAEQALSSPEAAAMLRRLKEAVVLSVDQQQLSWQIESLEFPQASKEAFLSDVSWPMTTIKMSSHLTDVQDPSAKLRLSFADSFAFEEPIALSIIQVSSQRKMSRWLVPNQVSPSFALTSDPLSTQGNTHSLWQWDAIKDYVWLGMKHIVPMGWDHVLFVLGLFFGIRNIANLLTLLTSFTLAHSLTLALSAYGAIQAPASIVEPLIAFSIMWVAIENCAFKQAQSWRFIIVFMFGLLHGLGFASALRELDLPTDSFVTALISFNVGIEIAQIGVVAFAYLLVGWFRHTPYWRSWVVIPASTIIAVIAFYWTLSRILF